jgi:hypothetical protein
MSTALPANEEELFSRAAELPAAERATYVDHAFAGDAARSFMESPPAGDHSR